VTYEQGGAVHLGGIAVVEGQAVGVGQPQVGPPVAAVHPHLRHPIILYSPLTTVRGGSMPSGPGLHQVRSTSNSSKLTLWQCVWKLLSFRLHKMHMLIDEQIGGLIPLASAVCAALLLLAWEGCSGGGGTHPGVLRMLPCAEEVHLLHHRRDVLAKRPENDGEVPFLHHPQFRPPRKTNLEAYQPSP